MTKSIRLVAKPNTRRADIERLAERLGWRHHRTTERSGDVPFEMTWISEGQGVAIHWIEDELTPVTYVAVAGPEIEPTVRLLRSELGFHDRRSMAEAVEGTRDAVALMDALHALGVHCSGPFDRDLFALFRWALNDPEPVVRRVALMAAANAGWAEFAPLVEFIREHDPVPEVREDAASVLDVFAHPGPEQPPEAGGGVQR